jgi:molecular chaperone GrpE
MDEISLNDDPKLEAHNAEPQFGLLDVVEAFTAMRHEWRTQSKQNRDLAQSMQASTDLLTSIESTLDQKLAATTGDRNLRDFISLVIDLDISLTRAVEATSERVVETEKTERLASIRHAYEQCGFFGRILSRKLYQQIVDELQNESHGKPNPTIEGVRLVLNRLRRMMSQQNLTRVETVGKAFDGETMKAISAIESENADSGFVVEEISPAYFHNGQLVRVAEVRVAK